MPEGMEADMMFKVSTHIKPAKLTLKNILRDGDSNVLYTADTVYTVESALHCSKNSMYAYTYCQNAIGMD